MSKRNVLAVLLGAITVLSMLLVAGCATDKDATSGEKQVPQKGPWGIYELDLATQDVRLIYSTSKEIFTPALRLSNKGDKLVFVHRDARTDRVDTAIYTLDINGKNLKKLTDDEFFNFNPVWSLDDSRIAFLSKRDKDVDIYVMNADGSDVKKLYDSGFHDNDIDWTGNRIVFTAESKIWMVSDNGREPVQITNPPDAGKWGKTNMPKGDYSPRLSPDGTKIVFERLEDPDVGIHGSYNIYVINSDGSGEQHLTNNGYPQGTASWSHSGAKLVYVVAAIEGERKYDLYMMNPDGTDDRSIMPDYFPDDFLCHSPIFSKDDSKVYFVGQWWQQPAPATQ
jgi:TolB protein